MASFARSITWEGLMFDNRWGNWSGDFAESFAGGLLDPAVRNHVPEILSHFGASVKQIDRDFPDDVSPGTFSTVLSHAMPRLSLPSHAREHVPDVLARFFEYLRETGRIAEGDEWASQVRAIGQSIQEGKKPAAASKGVTIRKAEGAPAVGRNDPCPCGSGKKFKKCCMTLG